MEWAGGEIPSRCTNRVKTEQFKQDEFYESDMSYRVPLWLDRIKMY